MTPTDLVARFRLDVDDDQTPYLWSDDEVWGYLNDAIQKWLGTPGGGVRDASTTSIVNLTVTSGDAWLELSPLITKIRSARLASTGRTLPIISFEELFGMDGMANSQFPVSTDDFDLTGPIKALVIGMEDNKLRTVRIPAANDTVKLVVERLSINTHAAADNPQKTIEVDSQYHLDLLFGMKALAYRKQDADTFDKTKADEAEAQFVARAAKAALDKARREHKPRLMVYGGL